MLLQAVHVCKLKLFFIFWFVWFFSTAIFLLSIVRVVRTKIFLRFLEIVFFGFNLSSALKYLLRAN